MDYKKRSYAQVLNQVHNKVIDQYLDSNAMNQIKKQELEAKKIESQLQNIKRMINAIDSYKYNQPWFEYLAGDISDTAREATSILNDLSSGTYRNEYAGLLFRRANHQSSGNKIADIFERELVSLLSTGVDLENRQNFLYQVAVGGSTTSIQGFENLTEDFKKRIIKRIDDFYKKKGKALKNSSDINRLKQGKIDIDLRCISNNGNGEIQIKADAHPLVKELLSVMGGKTFSLKNYQSIHVKEVYDEFYITLPIFKRMPTKNLIDFGDTNLYKAVIGSLSDFYDDIETRHRIFFRGLHYINNTIKRPSSTTINNVKQHFGHLKVIYEIKGSGLVDKEGNPTGPVDFIILNDPSSEGIYVKSANALIAEEIQKRIDAHSISIGGVQIAAQNFYS